MATKQEILYELKEAYSEIERHHRDFTLIRKQLDEWESGNQSPHFTLGFIRGVVG